MKRRSFLKTMGLLAGTPLIPKGKAMPQLGDLFAKLAMGQSLSAAEIETLRLGMNQQQAVASQMAALLTPGGNLDPNIFSHHSTEFSTLPHATASMVAVTDQAIPGNGTPTALTFDVDSALAADDLRFSWAHGITRNQSTGEFLLQGIPSQTIWKFTALIYWASTPANGSGIYVNEKDTATGLLIDYGDTTSVDLLQAGSIMMTARKASTSWQLSAIQTSGGSININDAIFQVARIR